MPPRSPGFRTRTTIFSPGRRADGEVYANAQRQLARSRRDIQKVFDDLDLLVFPTMADPPFKIEGGLTRNVSARNTPPFDVYGIRGEHMDTLRDLIEREKVGVAIDLKEVILVDREAV
jgi:Asp-tRNA(Asn)/Glu-tRNA(Gln) amidotransferase A subunit family amidase